MCSTHLVHRDVKPGNILLVQRSPSSFDVKAVLSDFGISVKVDYGRDSKTTTQVRGTHTWIATELLQEGKIVCK